MSSTNTIFTRHIHKRLLVSMTVFLRPISLGRVICDLSFSPITKQLSILVLKELPFLSLTAIISKAPCNLVLLTIVPTLPLLAPPVTKTVLPISSLIVSLMAPVFKSILTVSKTWMSGFGYLIHLASCVTIYGTLFGPIVLLATLTSLIFCSSFDLILTKVNLPLTSYNIL